MKKRISAILPPLVITLVCVLAVEAFYRIVEDFLLAPVKKTSTVAQVPEQKQVATHTTKRTAEESARIILERGLFGPAPSTAQELPTESKPEADLQATSLSLVLMGTVVSDGEDSRAIILEKNQKKQTLYRQGEVVQGAVLKEVLRGKVVLTYNNTDEILDMSEAAKYSAKIPVPSAAVATPDMRMVQPPPGMESQMMEQPSPDTPASDVQLKTMRPNRRTYSPSRNNPPSG